MPAGHSRAQEFVIIGLSITGKKATMKHAGAGTASGTLQLTLAEEGTYPLFTDEETGLEQGRAVTHPRGAATASTSGDTLSRPPEFIGGHSLVGAGLIWSGSAPGPLSGPGQ